MGQTWSRSGLDPRREGDSDPGGVTGSQHRYPPKSGHPFFASHFIMGGEKFDSPQPESFLFGENYDLNLLGGRAVSFPYPPPAAHEATKTLKSQINIRRDSVHLVLVPATGTGSSVSGPTTAASLPQTPTTESDAENPPLVALTGGRQYRVQFTFDSDVRCEITLFYFCVEEVQAQGVTYVPRRAALRSPTYTYNRGAAQVFAQTDHLFVPNDCTAELTTDDDPELLGLAIQCVSLEGDAPRQSHATLGSIEANADCTHFVIKHLKQKLFVDGLSYLLQEIYGLENKSPEVHSDEDEDDCGAECVVCMCDLRDTIILPCRHLCLCNACADSLRYQANNCPICRAPFRALLQIRAVQKIGQVTHPALPDPDQSQEGVPPGYQCVSLVEALNGPLTSAQSGVATGTDAVPAPKPKAKTRKGSRSSGARRTSSTRRQSTADPDPTRATERVPTAEAEDVDLSPEATSPEVAADPAASLSIESEVVPLRKSPSKRSVQGPGSSNMSLDLVDEELANMSVSSPMAAPDDDDDDEENEDDETEDESDQPLKISSHGGDIEEEEGVRQKMLAQPEDVEDEDFDDDPTEKEDEGEDEDDDDGAVVVNIASATGKRMRSSAPGTPTSNVSVRSSQDSASSSSSTKQLLATTNC